MVRLRLPRYFTRFLLRLKLRKKKRIMIELQIASGSTPSDWEKTVDRFIDKIKKANIQFERDKGYKPVLAPKRPRAPRRIIIRGIIRETDYGKLSQHGAHRVWSDPVLLPHSNPCNQITGACGSVCHTAQGAVGTVEMAASQIGAERLWQQGVTGKLFQTRSGQRVETGNIIIGVADTGVKNCRIGDRMVRKTGAPAHDPTDLNDYIHVLGWPPNPQDFPGFLPPGHPYFPDNHGTKTAFDALKICPDAKILDIAVGQTMDSDTGRRGLTASELVGVKEWILSLPDGQKPHVLTFCSGMARYCLDPEYAVKPDHLFTETIVELIEAGILVCFSAGNCGQLTNQPDCKSTDCYVCNDPAIPPGAAGCVGPDKSIWGANAHPRVISVGAATLDDGRTTSKWIGLSSQGRTRFQDVRGTLESDLNREKPDLCAPSNFKGEGSKPSDEGTSTAGAVMGGVLGLLKCTAINHDIPLEQDAARALLRNTASPLCEQQVAQQQGRPHSWSPQVGMGMVSIWDAANDLLNSQSPPVNWQQDSPGQSWTPQGNICPRTCRCDILLFILIIIMMIILIIAAILFGN